MYKRQDISSPLGIDEHRGKARRLAVDRGFEGDFHLRALVLGGIVPHTQITEISIILQEIIRCV